LHDVYVPNAAEEQRSSASTRTPGPDLAVDAKQNAFPGGKAF